MLFPANSMRAFLLHNRPYRIFLISWAVLSILQFIVFKLLYPFPSFYADSHFYILDAQAQARVGLWPIGYPIFLSLLHSISHSPILLVGVHYFLLQISTLYFIVTLFYIFRPVQWVQPVFFVLSIFNPIYLYVSNIVASDALFTALSILWFTELLWLFYRPYWRHVVLQAILLGLAFTIRYNALYYPLLVLLVLLIRSSWQLKISSLLLTALLLGSFIIYTREQNYATTGYKRFTAFSGWQLANNALYMYPYINKQRLVITDEEGKKINAFTKTFFDSIPPDVSITPQMGGWFMHDSWGPLNEYMFYRWASHQERSRLWAYHTASGPLAQYGQNLIRQYPLAYLQYYLLPNTWVYLYPPLEQLASYNQKRKDMLPTFVEWFDYKSDQVYGLDDRVELALMSLYAFLFLLLNMFFYISLIFLLWYWRQLLPALVQILPLALLAGLFAINTGFSILASPSVLRYQVFPMLIGSCFILLLAGAAIPYLQKQEWF